MEQMIVRNSNAKGTPIICIKYCRAQIGLVTFESMTQVHVKRARIEPASGRSACHLLLKPCIDFGHLLSAAPYPYSGWDTLRYLLWM